MKQSYKLVLVIVLLLVIIGVGALVNRESYSNKEPMDNKIYLYDEILRHNTIIEEEITKDKSLKYSNDVVGFYKEDYIYFFRGNVENNYIIIDSELWRIVSINENKSIRIIRENGINNNQLYKYNEDYSNYNYDDSIVKEELNKWYSTHLKDYEEFIIKENYCIEYEDTCIKEVSMKIGLLSEKEAIYAGSYKNMNYDAVYLNNKHSWWISSKFYDEFIGSAFSGYMNEMGSIESGFVDEEMTIRPVINLKWNTPIKGEGTLDNPYMIEK